VLLGLDVLGFLNDRTIFSYRGGTLQVLKKMGYLQNANIVSQYLSTRNIYFTFFNMLNLTTLSTIQSLKRKIVILQTAVNHIELLPVMLH